MSKRTRILLICLLVVPAALIGLLHTQFVERIILREASKRLPEGYQLDADRLDLNLFRLSVNLEKVKLSGPDFDLDLGTVNVNANKQALIGEIHLDSIRIAEGSFRLRAPDPQIPPSRPEAPLQIPSIRLGEATIENVALVYADKKAKLDLVLEQLGFTYSGDQLDLSLNSRAMDVAGREVPSVQVQVNGKTTDFKSVDDLILKLTTTKSRVVVMGKGGLDSPTEFKLEALLHDDLLPELPGLQVKGDLGEKLADIRITGSVPLLGESHALSITSRFPWTEETIQMPIEIQLGELLDGKISLTQDGTGLHGSYEINGKHAYLAGLNPFLEGLEQAGLSGVLSLPNKGGPSLSSKLILRGMPSFDMVADLADGKLRFSGSGSPIPGSRLTLSGGLEDNQLDVAIEGDLPHLEGLPEELGLPPELCAGPIRFRGKASSDFNDWRVDHLTVDVANLRYGPYLEEHLVVSITGDDAYLRGTVMGERLNPEAPILRFAADLVTEQWTELTLAVDARDMYLDDLRRYDLDVHAEGSGPLRAPCFEGLLRAVVWEGGKLALLDTPFYADLGSLDLPRLTLETAHARVSANLDVVLGEPLAWNADVVVDMVPDLRYVPIVGLQLPSGRLTLRGDQDQLTGKLFVPDQHLSVEDLYMPLDSAFALELDIEPPRRGFSGAAQEWSVAGIDLTEFSVNLDGGQLGGSTHFRLSQPGALRRALGAYWPADLALENAEGELSFNSDTDFVRKSAQLDIHWLDGRWCKAPFWLQSARFLFDGQLAMDPFKAHFAGMDMQVAGAKPLDAHWPAHLADGAEDRLGYGVAAVLDLTKPELAEEFLELPPEVKLKTLSGTVLVFIDGDLERPRASFTNINGGADYDGHDLQVTDLSGFYHNGTWLEGGHLDLDERKAEIHPMEGGFQLYSRFDTRDIENWMTGFVGSARFDTVLSFYNKPDDQFFIELVMHQEEGPLVYVDPRLVFENTHLAVTYDSLTGLRIHEGGGSLNQGTIALNGKAVPVGDRFDITLGVVADQIKLDLIDARAGISAALEWRMNDRENKMDATVYVENAYYSPSVAVKSLVEDLLTAVPELYFPDPTLEKIKLEAYVATMQPIIVDTDIAYMEVEAPWLIVGGNLADPRPVEGYITITRGSSLDLGNQSFVFQDSTVQFLRNRPDDPFLLISLEPTDDANKNAINLTGFVSELGNNADTQNLTNVIVNYMVGQVSSMVSLESAQGKTVFDDSFTLVVSKTLTRKLVTRYAIPVAKAKSQQRVELSIGPYQNNYLNLSSQDGNERGDLQHGRKFGWPGGNRPPKIRRVNWPKDTPKWVKKKFKLRKEHIYSETLWRRAELDMRRRLKGRGYLSPTLSHTWEDRVLKTDFAFGPRTLMRVEGLRLSNDERNQLFRDLPSLDKDGLRFLKVRAEQMAQTRGYPSANVLAAIEQNEQGGNTVSLRILLSQNVGETVIDFGPGNKILGGIYANKDQRNAFLTEYFISADSARGRLRARLAAKGYLAPELGEGEFLDITHFSMPVDPGPKARLVGIIENGQDVASPYLNRSFDSSLITTVEAELQKSAGKKALVRVRPRSSGHDVMFDVARMELEETIIESLTITGNNRISEKTIKRFMGFKDGMTQQELIEGQQRLIAAGPLSSARLRADKEASMEVLERNRWDADYLLSWDERNRLGHAVQFQDHQLFGGFNNLAMRVATSDFTDEFVSRLKFERVRGIPLDFTVGFNWRDEKKDQSAKTVVDDFIGDRIRQESLQTYTSPYIEFGYPLSRRQRLSLGITHETFDVTTKETYLDFPETEPEVLTSKLTALPVRLSYVYRHLDSLTNPHNGVLATFSADFFTKQGQDSRQGERYKGSLTSFFTWDKARLMWSNRLEVGYYRQDQAPSGGDIDPFTTQLFLLGGSTSLRGYSQDVVGPLSISFSTDENENIVLNLEPNGGNSLFFSSQELTYTTTWYGLGFTPFVDAGWVWSDYRDFLSSSLVVSGGLGVSLETPVGYFRLDWARPWRRDPIDNLLEAEFFSEDELKRINKNLETSWYLRFGRVF